MRSQPAPSTLFIRNRRRLRDKLPPGALVIIQSNDVLPTNADGTFGFKQCTDLFYLSGIDQEETILVIFPDAAREDQKEILFVRESSEHTVLWEGRKLDKPAATARSGVQNVRWTSEFPAALRSLMFQASEVFLTTNEHLRSSTPVQTRNDRLIAWCRENYPLHTYRRLPPLLYPLRAVKQPEEIAMMEKACAITTGGFKRVLGMVKPGIGEWEVEAELLHEFTRQGSRGFAYPPIIGTAENACILHYVENSALLKDGDMLLLDVAAEYGNWNADLTRTIPVNGKFSPRQREVYHAVLRVLRQCETILRPGIRPSEYHKQTLAFMEEQLISLGLFTADEAKAQDKDKPLVKRYFPHGTSHHLGLDVHDVHLEDAPVEAGNVFTIEPGIYIREENMGIRLENDYLIGENGNTNLLADAPIEADEIEDLMAGAKRLGEKS